jgi:hypothetical protein
MIYHPSVYISRNSGRSNKLPDDGRLLPIMYEPTRKNKGVVQSVLIAGFSSNTYFTSLCIRNSFFLLFFTMSSFEEAETKGNKMIIRD